MASDLEKKIITQIEYYFGDINLPRDKFLQEKIKEDEGWITLEVLLTFKRLASLSTDQEVIANALEKAERKLVVVHEDKKKVRRSPEFPAPEYNEEFMKKITARTAYAKGFLLTATLDEITAFLEAHGPIESCSKRTYQDKDTKETKFKGSCFIIFKDEETCKKFIEAESIKYEGTELVRKWQDVYKKEKQVEIETRKNKRNKGNAKKEEETKEVVAPKLLPGTAIHFAVSKGEDDLTLSREDIKEKVGEILKDKEISFIDYSKGQTEGHLRFDSENSADELYKLLEDGKLKIGDADLTFKLLNEEELAAYLKKATEEREQRRRNFSKNNGRKRKGNFSHRGPKSKK